MNMQWNSRFSPPHTPFSLPFSSESEFLGPGVFPRHEGSGTVSSSPASSWISHPHISPQLKAVSLVASAIALSHPLPRDPGFSFLRLIPALSLRLINFSIPPTPTQTQGSHDGNGGKMLSVFLWLKKATLWFLSLRGHLKIAWKLSCRKPVSSFSDTGFSDPPGSPGSTFSPCLTIFNPWEAAEQKVGQLSPTVLKELPHPSVT